MKCFRSEMSDVLNFWLLVSNLFSKVTLSMLKLFPQTPLLSEPFRGPTPVASWDNLPRRDAFSSGISEVNSSCFAFVYSSGEKSKLLTSSVKLEPSTGCSIFVKLVRLLLFPSGLLQFSTLFTVTGDACSVSTLLYSVTGNGCGRSVCCRSSQDGMLDTD